MTRLRLRLDIWGLEEESSLPQYGVVANIYDLTDRPGKRSKRNLVIPAVAGPEQYAFHDVELDPGRYIVEAILPSGEVVAKEVSLEDTDEPRVLSLWTRQSPHEWLGWQQFLGNVQPDVYKELQSEARYATAVDARVLSVRTSAPLPPDPCEHWTPDALASRGYFAKGSWADFFAMGSAAPDFGVTHVPSPNIGDSLSTVSRFETGVGWGVPFDGEYRAERYQRHYFFIRAEEGIPAQYSVLPIPWWQADASGVALVEVLVRRTTVLPGIAPGVDAGHRVSATVNDRMVGSVIGYLGGGDLPAAAAIITRARDMLFGKVANPLAAAAGAYVLLGGPEWGGQQYWHEWVYNLMDWFPWLPDGAIQHAWVKLRTERSQESLDEARASLLDGYRRGLPFYSRGVGLLLDGMTMFANDARAEGRPDEEVEAALQTVRQVALRTDMRQPFTTVVLR